MSMVWRDISVDEPRIRLGRVASAVRTQQVRVRAAITEARREHVTHPPIVAPRIVVPLRPAARW